MNGEAHAARAAADPSRRTPALAYMAADWKRIKGTWILPLTFLGPLGVTVLGVILFLLKGDYLMRPYHAGTSSGWTVVTSQIGMVHVFSLGLGAALLASMIVDVEHRSDTWKQMFGLPVSRAAVYSVKFALAATLLTISSVLMSAGYAVLMVWQKLGPLPLDKLAIAAALPWLAALPLLAFQLLVSASCRNQALPLTLGVLAPMMGMGLSQLPAWLPWRLITEAMVSASGGAIAGGPGDAVKWLTPATIGAASVAWVVVLVSAGAIALARREIR